MNGVEAMHKKILLSTTLVAMLLLVPASLLNAQGALRIAYPSFPPFHWVNETGEMTGFFHEIITEALVKRMGMTVVWNEYPWPRCQENLKAGKDDAIMTVPTAERAVYTVTHKDPFYQKELHIFTYVDHHRMAEIKGIKKIEGIKEGRFSVITYSGNGWHKENVEPLGIKTYEAAYLGNVWKMLADRRGDLVLEWPHGAWPDIRRVGATDRVIDTGFTISTMPFHLLIRKDSPHVSILNDLNEVIKKMFQDGTMTSILSKCF